MHIGALITCRDSVSVQNLKQRVGNCEKYTLFEVLQLIVQCYSLHFAVGDGFRRLRSETKVWFDDSEAREEFRCLLIAHGCVDNDVSSLLFCKQAALGINYLPVDWSNDFILVPQLKRVNNP